MIRKSVLYALAVVVLMGTMAVAALAGDDHGTYMYGPTDSYLSNHSEEDVFSSDAGEIREPMETGALPDERFGTVANDGWVNMDVGQQDSRPELWGLPNIQSGGGE